MIVNISGKARLHRGYRLRVARSRAEELAQREHVRALRDFLRWFSLTDAAESDLLKLLFQNTAWANIGDASGLQPSATAGSFYISLHTADPGETGTQTTSETGYTNYVRVAVARSSGGWTVSGTTQVANAAAVGFAQSGSSSTITYFGVGTASSAAGHLIASGALTSSLAVANLITPSFAIGDLAVTAD